MARLKQRTDPLNLDEMRAFLRAGRSLIFQGRHINAEADLPTLEELVQYDPVIAHASARAMQRQIDEHHQQIAGLRRALEGIPPERRPPESTGVSKPALQAARARDPDRPPPGYPAFGPPPDSGAPFVAQSAGYTPGAGYRSPDVAEEPEPETPSPPAAATAVKHEGDDAPQDTGALPAGTTTETPPRPVVPDPTRPAAETTGAGRKKGGGA